MSNWIPVYHKLYLTDSESLVGYVVGKLTGGLVGMSLRGDYYEIQDLNTNIHREEQRYCYNDKSID